MLNTQIIGTRITEARKKIAISQAQLAERLFISPQAVGKWERGESMPDIITLNRLAEILGVDLNYFSESFQSSAPETAPADSTVNQSDEPPSEKKKLNWDMSSGNWVDADFSGLKNLKEKFSSSNMKRCLFVGSDLSGFLLESNNINSCDFSGSDISYSQVRSSAVVSNSFKGCVLRGTEFSESHIKSCDFSGADLTGAEFKSGSFLNNALADAIWNRTSFSAMQISDVVFEGSLEDCSFENCAFSRVTFQNATLTNTFFKGRSLKRVRFADCKADKLTYAFLKNGKADLAGVTLIP